MKRLLPLGLLALALSGCATAKFSNVGGRTIADVTNTGWYLLNLIPLASGNPEHPNAFGCKLFSRTVTLENNIRMLDYGYGEVVSYTTDESVLFFLFKRHACHTSAELIRKTPNP